MSGSVKLSSSVGEVDAFLKDLNEKKLNFQRNVMALVAELEEVRGRLASREESVLRETQNRQVAETKARRMEHEICQLQRSLADRSGQLQESASIAKQYLNELEELRSQLSLTQATVDANAASMQHVQAQSVDLLKKIDEKRSSLEEQGHQVNMLAEKLHLLEMDFKEKEATQKQLKAEVLRIGHGIVHEVRKAAAIYNHELEKILEKVFSKNFEKINKHLAAMDEEMSRLRLEIKDMAECWIPRTKELKLQLERHRTSEQELQKRVLKLEFCLQEAQFQTWELQSMGEKGDEALMELRDQLTDKQRNGCRGLCKQNFWEYFSFKIAISVSVLVLVVYVRW